MFIPTNLSQEIFNCFFLTSVKIFIHLFANQRETIKCHHNSLTKYPVCLCWTIFINCIYGYDFWTILMPSRPRFGNMYSRQILWISGKFLCNINQIQDGWTEQSQYYASSTLDSGHKNLKPGQAPAIAAWPTSTAFAINLLCALPCKINGSSWFN